MHEIGHEETGQARRTLTKILDMKAIFQPHRETRTFMSLLQSAVG
jgi:hypothetical protein